MKDRKDELIEMFVNYLKSNSNIFEKMTLTEAFKNVMELHNELIKFTSFNKLSYEDYEIIYKNKPLFLELSLCHYIINN
jgi:hypothetical protein